MLYEFSKGVRVGTATKNIQRVYFDNAPALSTVKKWFRWDDFKLNDQPRLRRPSDIVEDDLLENINRRDY